MILDNKINENLSFRHIGSLVVSRNHPGMLEAILSKITHFKFTKDGKWLVTVDKRPIEGKHSETNYTIIKFWNYSDISQRFELNTEVIPPHKDVTSLSICPKNNFVCTTGSEGKFAIWEIVKIDNTDDNQYSNFSWRCRSIGYYRNKLASASTFHSDGSLLAITYGTTITIWDPVSITLKKTLKYSVSSSPFKFVYFLSNSPFLIAANYSHIYVWNLLTLKVSWFSEMIEIHSIAVDPVKPQFAVLVNRKISDYSFWCLGDETPYDLNEDISNKLPSNSSSKQNRTLPQGVAGCYNIKSSNGMESKKNGRKNPSLNAVPIGKSNFI